ncbi:hypothetical protein GBZ48_21920 [Azospirillum melinis]|uniref:Uncharacterized protein n=1 Tax=Azospirillum melinis TaxID=328839 RepID=A0ABX2KJG9_9PROT|nr:hypothetical protein [Azospirillum melinis]
MWTPTSPQPWTSVSCQVKAKFGIMMETPVLRKSGRPHRWPASALRIVCPCRRLPGAGPKSGRTIPRRTGACQVEWSGLDSPPARCYDSGGFS